MTWIEPLCFLFKELLAGHDFTKFKSLQPNMMALLDELLPTDIAKLMPLLRQEELEAGVQLGVQGGAFLGTRAGPFVEELQSCFGRGTIQLVENTKRFLTTAAYLRRLWAGSVFDHIHYHRRLRNTWKQCYKECRRVSETKQKSLKTAINERKKFRRWLWDHEAAGSTPVTRTKKQTNFNMKFICFFLCLQLI